MARNGWVPEKIPPKKLTIHSRRASTTRWGASNGSDDDDVIDHGR